MKINKLEIKNYKNCKYKNLDIFLSLEQTIKKLMIEENSLEALVFVLYGQDDQEYQQNSESMYISIEFEFDFSTYKVVREFNSENIKSYARIFKNNEIMANGIIQTTISVTTLLQMNKEIFIEKIKSFCN